MPPQAVWCKRVALAKVTPVPHFPYKIAPLFKPIPTFVGLPLRLFYCGLPRCPVDGLVLVPHLTGNLRPEFGVTPIVGEDVVILGLVSVSCELVGREPPEGMIPAAHSTHGRHSRTVSRRIGGACGLLCSDRIVGERAAERG